MRKIISLICVTLILVLNLNCRNFKANADETLEGTLKFEVYGKFNADKTLATVDVNLRNSSSSNVNIESVCFYIKMLGKTTFDEGKFLVEGDGSYSLDDGYEIVNGLLIPETAIAVGSETVKIASLTFKLPDNFEGNEIPVQPYCDSENEWSAGIVDADTIALETPALEIKAEKISLNSSYLSLKEGDTAQLTAEIEPEYTTNKEITWTSSDDSVATVTNGLVTAVKAGSTTITASCGEKAAISSIEVTPILYYIDQQTGIGFDWEEGTLPSRQIFTVNDVSKEESVLDDVDSEHKVERILVFDITINGADENGNYDGYMSEGKLSTGNVRITIPMKLINETLGEWDVENTILLRLNPGESDDVNCEGKYDKEKDAYVFETDHFSNYALIDLAKEPQPEKEGNTSSSTSTSAEGNASSGSLVVVDQASSTIPVSSKNDEISENDISDSSESTSSASILTGENNVLIPIFAALIILSAAALMIVRKNRKSQ